MKTVAHVYSAQHGPVARPSISKATQLPHRLCCHCWEAHIAQAQERACTANFKATACLILLHPMQHPLSQISIPHLGVAPAELWAAGTAGREGGSGLHWWPPPGKAVQRRQPQETDAQLSSVQLTKQKDQQDGRQHGVTLREGQLVRVCPNLLLRRIPAR